MAGFWEELADQLDLPGDAAAGQVRVTMIGTARVLVENHRGLLAYGENAVEIRRTGGLLRIRGDGLLLKAMDREAILVAGTIFGVDME